MTELRLTDMTQSNYLPLGKTVTLLSFFVLFCFAFLFNNLRAVLQPFGPFPLAREGRETFLFLGPH